MVKFINFSIAVEDFQDLNGMSQAFIDHNLAQNIIFVKVETADGKSVVYDYEKLGQNRMRIIVAEPVALSVMLVTQ